MSTSNGPEPRQNPTPEKAAEIPSAVPATEPASPAVAKLTPEEQMALFEKELKENDWGHQPC
jgi:hypothetical protein